MTIKINKVNNTTDLAKTKKVEELKKALNVENWNATFVFKEQDAKKFIDNIVDESRGILKKIRIVQWEAPTMKIAKILDNGKLLRPEGEYKRTAWTGKEAYKYGTGGLTLTTKQIEGKIYISDQELEDNIEGNNFKEHVAAITKRKIANELLEVAFYGRKLDNPSWENGILNVFNGIVFEFLKNGNVIDWNWATIERKTYIKAKKALATKYRADAEFFVDSDLKTDTDELYNDPNKPGNTEIIKDRIAGLPINEVPLMRSDLSTPSETIKTTVSATASAGQKVINVNDDLTWSIQVGDEIVVEVDTAQELTYKVAAINTNSITTEEDLIYDLSAWATINKVVAKTGVVVETNPKNAIIYIQRNIKVEFERLAPDGYNVWYTMRMDQAVENPQAWVVVKNIKSKD